MVVVERDGTSHEHAVLNSFGSSASSNSGIRSRGEVFGWGLQQGSTEIYVGTQLCVKCSAKHASHDSYMHS